MKFNPEARFSREISGELTEPQEALYKILVPENQKRAIDIREFQDLYGKDTIEKDLRYVEDLEGKFSEDETPETSRKLSELFEAIVNSQIEESDWMGGNASVIVPSRFDDIANGVDTIVEFDDETAISHLALAIDVTESNQGITSKLKRIKDSIENNELSKAKYFKSNNFRGELRQVPRVIVGAEGNTIKEITDLLLRFKRMQKTVGENRKNNDRSESAQSLMKKFSEIRTELADHPFQRIMLLEIKTQLETFRDYAQSRGKMYVAKDYQRMLDLVDGIIQEKNNREEDQAKTIPQDRIFDMISEQMQTFAKN